MDLERIKQNLRLRSGRSKKPRKQPVAHSKADSRIDPIDQKSTPNGVVQKPAQPAKQAPSSKQPPSVAHTDRKAEDLKPEPVDAVQVLEHRPELPHASTGLDLKASPKAHPTRFGMSGIERPPKNPATKSKLLRTMSEADTGSSALYDDSSSALDFDLRPPPPRPKPPSVESLSESLFSSGHLNFLLRDAQYLARFTSFLTKYRPQYHPVLLRYLETQKAIKAIEYANAVAEGVPVSSGGNDDASIPRASVAATLDKDFEQSSLAAFRLMVDSALPMYITYNLVKLVTECLINEITGRQTSLMRDLVGGLSEVFCLSDPKQEDNPIIYASEEFFRYTGYGPEDVIGQNCRFLQGSKTKRESVARLRQTIAKGESICETLLNYRRDGRPFINLLLIAPLHDDKGNVKYHIGAQIDVTGLVARGKGLDGFERYVTSREVRRRQEESRSREAEPDKGFRKPRALEKLRELSELFDLEESAVVRSHSRSASASGDEDERSIGSSRKSGRRVLGESDISDNDDEDAGDNEDQTWKLGQSGRSGLSGKLPGVYESYLLVRPAPSLRIIFVSPKLRQRLGNVIQHPFLSHLAASKNTLSGLKESFGTGVPVSAKVNFLLEAGKRRDGTTAWPGSKLEDAGHGRVCWISATPLLGGDDKIGVWMIVVVEKIKGPANSKRETLVRSEQNRVQQPSKPDQARPSLKGKMMSSQQQLQSPGESPGKQNHDVDDNPIKPRRLEDGPALSHDPPSQSTPPEEIHVERSEDQDHHQHAPEHEKLVGKEGEEVEGSEDHDPHENSPEQDQLAEKEDEEEAEGSNKSSGDFSDEALHETEEDFVKTETQLPAPEQSNGSDVEEDSEGDLKDDAEGSSGTAVVENRKDSMPDNGQPATREEPKSPGEDERQNGLNTNHSSPGHEDAVVNHKLENSSEEDDDDTPSPSPPETSGKEHVSSNNTHYMDYLRHPGSLPSGEYNRAVSGTFLSARYDLKDEEQDEDEDFNDVDCVRSPYSVD